MTIHCRFGFDEPEESRMRRSDAVDGFREELARYQEVIQAKEASHSGSLEEKRLRMECEFCAARIRNKKMVLDTKP